MSASQIRWGRIAAGGLFIELAMFAIVIPIQIVAGEQVFYYSVPVAAIATAFLVALWVARPLESRFVLHGALAALVASLIYIALTASMGASVPWLFWASHGLRLLAGIAGGMFAERRAR